MACVQKTSQSRVWGHMSSLLQSYNRRNSYSTEEDEEYVHEFDSEFVGLNSSEVAFTFRIQFSSARYWCANGNNGTTPETTNVSSGVAM